MSTPSPAGSTVKAPRVYACLQCQQRKVKCDKSSPCSNCVQAGWTCIVQKPAPPRRKKKVPQIASHNHEGVKRQRVDHVRYEGVRSSVHDEAGWPSTEKQRSAAVLSSNLWAGLENEFRDPRESHGNSPQVRLETGISNDTLSPAPEINALLFASGRPYVDLKMFHPTPVHMFWLWQTFLDNVHPLSKLLHAPTVQYQITAAAQNLDQASPGLTALMFAIYTAAVSSSNNTSCENAIGESKVVLLTRYSSAARQALINADYVRSSDLTVLQAFVLLLLATRRTYDPHALWILTGIAVRKGQTLNLHRNGIETNLSIFESEIRRRLWWQIVICDSRSGQLSGSKSSSFEEPSLIKLPLNVSDAELDPAMKEPPVEHTSVTEMVFCLTRYEFGKFLADSQGRGKKLNSPHVSLEEKDRIINELENHMENKFMKYCDPSIALHALATAVARAVICKLRLVAHHPRQYADKGASMSQEERRMLLATSMKLMEDTCLAHSTKALERYLWHIDAYFQVDAFVFMLSELRSQTTSELVDRAWELVAEVYKYHPEMIDDTDNALYVAVGNLMLQAWSHREAELVRQHQSYIQVPEPVLRLRARMPTVERSEYAPVLPDQPRSTGARIPAIQGHADSATEANTVPEEFYQGTQLLPAPMDFQAMDWDYWTELFEQDELAAMGRYG